jgi:hypothetical protein
MKLSKPVLDKFGAEVNDGDYVWYHCKFTHPTPTKHRVYKVRGNLVIKVLADQLALKNRQINITKV